MALGNSLEGLELSPQEVQRYRNATFRAVNFVETYFYAPWDRTNLIKLTKNQKDAIDCIQFGFPLSKHSFEEVPVEPKGVIMIWPRQYGKSYAVAAAAAALSLMFPYCHIGMIGSEEDIAILLMDKSKWFVQNSIFKDQILKERVNFLGLTNGSLLRSHTCSEKSIRGYMYHYLLADEVRWMDESVLFGAALPTTRHGIRWIMLTTPKGRKLKFMDYYYKGLETRPVICTKCKTRYSQADFNITEFPADRIPEGLFPCVECQNETYKYGMGLFAVPHVDAWDSPLFTVAEINATLDMHDWSPWARQEYLGEIIDEASMVFMNEHIQHAIAVGETGAPPRRNVMIRPSKKIVYVMGVDYGKKHDASCFAITHFDRKTGRVVLDYLETIAGEFDVERSYTEIQARLFELAKFYNPYWIVPDATGLGDPLVEEIEDDLRKHRLRCKILNYPKTTKGFVITKKSKPELIGEFLKRLRAKPIQFEMPGTVEPEIDEFVKEMLRFECEADKHTTYIKYGTQTYHDDRVVAVALSVWGHRQRIWIPTQVKTFNYANLMKTVERF